jgi:hypothetical protein
MAGRPRSVLSRIVSAGVLLVLLAAGCGGSARPDKSATGGVPRALASKWATQATQVADVAATGDDCGALQLAASLRADVIDKTPDVPARLQSPLLESVNSLAERLTCTHTVTMPTTPDKEHRKPPPKEPPPKHHKHGDQRNEG